MALDPELKEKITSSSAPSQIKELLVGLVGEIDNLLPLLAKDQGSRTGYMAERLAAEVTNPGLETYLWEVALDIIMKAAHSQGEAGKQAIDLASRLRPMLKTCFEPPGEVSLEEITEENVIGIILLSDTLTEPKRSMVANNAILLSQALVSKHAWYRAIYAGKTLAGFLMLYDNPEEPTYFLWRFMIAEPFHGRGYGCQAIQRLIEYVRTRPGATELLVSCGEGEGSPEGFYAKQGFTRTGKKEGDEVVMRIGL